MQTLKPMSVPDGPGFVELVRVAGSAEALTVYWPAISFPQDRGSLVDRFLVQCSPDSAFLTGVLNFTALLNQTVSVRGLDSQNRPIQSYVIDGLQSGRAYYVRVGGQNSVGLGPFTPGVVSGQSSLALAPLRKSDQIAQGSVRLDPLVASETYTVAEASSSLKLSFSAPVDTHGSEVVGYRVEWWDGTATMLPEVASLSVLGGE